MKKIGIILLALAMFNITSFAKSEKVDTTFTFQNFVPTSADVVSAVSRNTSLGGSRVAYPVFSGDAKVIKTMNKNMEKFISRFKGSKKGTYTVTYNITGSNAYFVSVLFDVVNNTTKEKSNEAISFNVKDGKKLELKDLFVNGYSEALNGAINDRITQFGITTLDTKKVKFKGVTKNQKFYMEDDSIVLFYNQGEATDFGTGQLFVPFITLDLMGIIK